MTVPPAPRGTTAPLGDLLVSPKSGTALSTVFTLSAANWVSAPPEGPLTYQFRYYVLGQVRTSALVCDACASFVRTVLGLESCMLADVSL